jgi:hypothetical protein
MRITIVHDSMGNIVSLVACPLDAPQAHPEAKPGERVAEVDAPEITAELGAERVFDHLKRLAENYRVEVASETRLTQK